MAMLSEALSGLRVSSGVSTRPESHRSGSASFGPVKELGRFSTGAKKEYLDDQSELHYLKLPSTHRLNWDLSIGYDSWIPYKSCHLDLICDWLLRQPSLPKTHFVSRRSCITHIAHTPYSTDPWTIAIVRIKDTFYLTEFELDEAESMENRVGQMRMMTYWGHKFESYLCADAKGVLDIEGAVNCSKSFRRVVERTIGKHGILIAGEIDCLDKKTGDFVELKLCKNLVHPKQEVNFHRYKTCKWWLQSVLIGVPRIIVGNRSENGFVESLTEWAVDKLAVEGRSRRFWDSQVCLNFADAVLHLIKNTVTENNPKQVWLLERKAGSHISAPRRLGPSENGRYSFLPKEFLATL